MPWGADTAFTSATAINNTVEEFLEDVALNPRELCHVQLEVDNEHASTVTDDLIVSVYTTLDDTAEVWDDFPLLRFTVTPSGVAVERIAFVVGPGIFKFRIGGLSSGATDTYTMGGDYRIDGVNA
jgi:hypothetical protein